MQHTGGPVDLGVLDIEQSAKKRIEAMGLVGGRRTRLDGLFVLSGGAHRAGLVGAVPIGLASNEEDDNTE